MEEVFNVDGNGGIEDDGSRGNSADDARQSGAWVSNNRIHGEIQIHRASEDLAALEAGGDHPVVEVYHGSQMVNQIGTKIVITMEYMDTLRKIVTRSKEI